MIYHVAVPETVADVKEVRVLEWHKTPGELVSAGDLLVEFETHKAIIEVRAVQKGYLRQILAIAGEWHPIGEPVALISSTPEEPLPIDPKDSSVMELGFELS